MCQDSRVSNTSKSTARGFRASHWPPRLEDDGVWRSSPEFDQPRTDLTQVLVLASTPRVASTFFTNNLAATGQAGFPNEYALGAELVKSRRMVGRPRRSVSGMAKQLKARSLGVAAWETVGELNRTSLIHHFRDLARRRATPNGVFAIKLMATQSIEVFDRNSITMALWDVPVRWVYIRRKDRLAQAISLIIAYQSGQWIPSQQSIGIPEYDSGKIERSVTTIAGWDSYWRRKLRESECDPLLLWSEDLIGDTDGAIDQTLELIGSEFRSSATNQFGDPNPWQNPDREVRQQWIDRFLHDRPDLAAQRWAEGID